MTGSTRIPETQSSNAVGVHVLGCALELGKHRESVTSATRLWVMNLEKNSPVALNDEGTVGIHNQPVYVGLLSLRCLSTPAGW